MARPIKTIDLPRRQYRKERPLPAGANREDNACSPSAQESLVDRIVVPDLPPLAPGLGPGPEVRVEERVDVLPLDRLMQKRDQILKPKDAGPCTVVHDRAAGVEVGRRYTGR